MDVYFGADRGDASFVGVLAGLDGGQANRGEGCKTEQDDASSGGKQFELEEDQGEIADGADGDDAGFFVQLS